MADLERDVVDGLDVAHVAIEHDPAPDREVDLELLDLDQVVLAAQPAASLRLFCHSSAGTGLKQAMKWPGSISASWGTSRPQRSIR